MNSTVVYNHMRRNLRTFGEWMEAKAEPKAKSKAEPKDEPKDEPKPMSFDQWLKQNLNIDIGDMMDVAPPVKANTVWDTGDDDSIEMKPLTIYKLKRNPDSNAATLTVQGKSDPNDPEKAAFPHASASPYHGKKIVIAPRDYADKMLKFPPQPAGGAPGGPAGGLGL